jgi:hypothetical protein
MRVPRGFFNSVPSILRSMLRGSCWKLGTPVSSMLWSVSPIWSR